MDYETVFKALGEQTRIRIVKLLSVKPMYVCELEAVLEMSQPRVSQHLKILRHAGLLHMRKEGQRAVYSLREETFEEWICGFTDFLKRPLETIPEFRHESIRMNSIADDPSIAVCKSAGARPQG